MTHKVLLSALFVVVAACATVENETTSTIELNGRSYELRTRSIDGANGTYTTHSVRANGTYRTCDPMSPGSCEAAIRNTRRGLNG